MKLSILIPTLPERAGMLARLEKHLNKQIEFYDDNTVNILIHYSETDSIGKKRNELLRNSDGEYICFIDDDDRVSDDYVNRLLWGIRKGVDCCSLRGEYSVNGKFDGIFEHSVRYKEWRTTNNEIKYERYPTPLNCIKRDIARLFKFPEISHGEDHNWAKQIHESGLLKTECYIDEIIYYYDKCTNHVQPKR